MKKTLYSFAGATAIFLLLGLLAGISRADITGYPYPQNYTTDQRRFDQQQASNLVMRKLQTSTTGQWAIGVVNLDSGNYGATVSTATYGKVDVVGTTTLSPAYSVKKYSLLSVGGLTLVTTNATGGTLYLDDGMSYEQTFDFPVSSFTLSVNLSTGICHYAITGVK